MDIVGVDVYDIDEDDGPTIEEFKKCLFELRKFANEHGKVSAITELGNRKKKNMKWVLPGAEPREPNYEWITQMVRHTFEEQEENGGEGGWWL